MEQRHQQWRRLLTTTPPPPASGRSFSYKNATVLLSILNLLLLLLLLRDISSSSSSSSSFTSDQLTSDQLVKESEKFRLAMKPLQLIKTIRDIESENENLNLQTVIHGDEKQTAAMDLSNRLKDIHSSNDAANVKALEEWRKRKMERARKRDIERNGTLTS